MLTLPEDLFATSGAVVELWSTQRSEPLQSHTWGADSSSCVRFNPVEVRRACCCHFASVLVCYHVFFRRALPAVALL
jgi:DDB1- and CUL4-associated factor 13